MASTNKTTNYELSQFQSSDIPAWLTDYNGDMQKIDAGIHAAKVQAEGAASGVSALQTAVSGKQDRLTFDSAPISGSSNPVTSGGIYNALQNVSVQTDAVPTQGSTKAVQSGGVFTALQGKQNTLTFDSTPTQGSTNPVTSGGVYSAIAAAGGATPQFITVNGTPPTVSSGGVQGQAVKIGNLVIVSFCGFYTAGAVSYLTLQGVTPASAPARQYVELQTGTSRGVRYIDSDDFIVDGGNTRIDVGGDTSNMTFTSGTIWFICN